MLLSFSSVINAQVTMGSDLSPSTGAILDLKQYESNNAVTSTKGLGMPRVQLKDLTKLLPMLENDNDYINNIGGKQDKENSLHVGLMVYNVNKSYCETPYYDDGLYVWNGNSWDYLGDQNDVLKFNDQDGNQFSARQFGNAGIWMTENLRATTYANGTAAPTLGAQSSDTEKYYCYPAPSTNSTGIKDGTLSAYFDQRPEIGLLYNPSAALNGENTFGGEQEQIAGDIPGPNEIESLAPDGHIQGICPNGWHIPSDREWNQLEREIYTNANIYSTYTAFDIQSWNPNTWNRDWETESSQYGQLRGSSTSEGHGRAMLTSCPLEGSVYTGTFTGKSLPSYLGGFDVLPVGAAYQGNVSFGVDEFGMTAYFFTSSRSFDGFLTWYRTLGMDYYTLKQRVDRHLLHPGGSDAFFSVRCKKNE